MGQAISNARLYSALINEFYLPASVINQLDKHFILKMAGYELAKKLQEDGTVEWYGENFILVCPQGEVKKQILACPRVKLSFRKLQDSSIAPLVLVRKG